MSGFTRSLARPAALALATLVAAAAFGVAFAGWLDHSPAIFQTLVEQGLAWCF